MSNSINLATSITVSSQLPLDGKAYFPTLSSMADLGESDYKAFIYQDSLVVECVENKEQYIWRERLAEDTEEIITGNYTYPAGAISNGFDYSGKIYNFFLYKPRIEVEIQGAFVVAKPKTTLIAFEQGDLFRYWDVANKRHVIGEIVTASPETVTLPDDLDDTSKIKLATDGQIF